jgi:multidrug efflux pump subunit AcrA (membrane-fusion protein)
MNTVRVLIFLALIATVCAACKQRRLDGGEEGESNAPPVVAVKISHVREGALEEYVDATGRMEVLRKQKVISPVSGTLVSIKVLEGMPVRQNDELVTIRPKEAQTAIAGAEELLHSARTEAERQEAQKALELARSTQTVVIVRAGFNGVVATRSVTEGELVTENAELMTVVDLSTIIFVADVPLQDAPRVRKGQHAMLEFQPLPGQHYAAVVDAVYPGSELQSQTVGVRLQLSRVGEQARQLLKPSMMGVCRIVTGVHKNILIVPRIALIRDDEKNLFSVVVVDPDSVARVLSVSVGVSTDSAVEVKGPGLGPGTPVVVEGNYALPDSTRVRW